MNQSGGELNAFISDSQNKVQLSWPIEYPGIAKPWSEYHRANRDDQAHSLKFRTTKVSAEQGVEKQSFTACGEHYADAEFGTATAAKYLFMSERSLQRRFKLAYHKTFKEHEWGGFRLEHACERLLMGEKVIE